MIVKTRSQEEKEMHCKKYRACLAGVIALVLVVGIFVFVKNIKNNQVPTEATLVENCEETEDGSEIWA